MRRLLIIAAAAVALAAPTAAPAHNALSFKSAHQWLEDKILGKTEAPPVHPVEPCTPDREGEYIIIYDPILKVYVQWSCRCPGDGAGCRWFRTAWFPEEPYIPGAVTTRHWVKDTHRSCRSIVCKRHRHLHYWFAITRAESPLLEWTP